MTKGETAMTTYRVEVAEGVEPNRIDVDDIYMYVPDCVDCVYHEVNGMEDCVA